MNNPFGGRQRFSINLHEDEIPEGVTMGTVSSSRERDTTYFSTDGGKTAEKMEALKEHFNGRTTMPYKGDEPRPGEG